MTSILFLGSVFPWLHSHLVPITKYMAQFLSPFPHYQLHFRLLRRSSMETSRQ